MQNKRKSILFYGRLPGSVVAIAPSLPHWVTGRSWLPKTPARITSKSGLSSNSSIHSPLRQRFLEAFHPYWEMYWGLPGRKRWVANLGILLITWSKSSSWRSNWAIQKKKNSKRYARKPQNAKSAFPLTSGLSFWSKTVIYWFNLDPRGLLSPTTLGSRWNNERRVRAIAMTEGASCSHFYLSQIYLLKKALVPSMKFNCFDEWVWYQEFTSGLYVCKQPSRLVWMRRGRIRPLALYFYCLCS